MARRANNEGSVYKRKVDGRWVAALTLPDGKRRAFYAATQAEALAKRDAAKRKLDDGLPLGDGRTTVSTYLRHWITAAQATMLDSTWVTHEGRVRLHLIPGLGRVRLASLTPAHLQTLYARKLATHAPRTIQGMHSTLRMALDEAVSHGYIARNVAAVVTPPHAEAAEMQVLTLEQARHLLRHTADDPLAALYELALTTGARRGELFGLRWEDIDAPTMRIQRSLVRVHGKGLVMHPPKTKRGRREVYLSQRAICALQAHRERQDELRERRGEAWQHLDLVFPNRIGGMANPGTVIKASFPAMLAAAGLPRIRFHDLRHTAATLMLLRGINVKVVSEMLGHATISMTLDTYAHVLPSMQSDAAAAMDQMFGDTSSGGL